MYLLIPVLLSIVVALARGKDLTRFALGGPFRAPWLVIFILVYRFAIYPQPVSDWAIQNGVAPYLNPVPYILLLVLILLNHRLRPVSLPLAVIGLGTFLNLVAVLANGGYMPVSLEALQHTSPPEEVARMQQGIPDCHSTLMDEFSRLTFLADNFYVPRPFPFPAAFSVGDFIIGVGAFWLFQVVFPPKR
ncbi:MAG: DUF5317 domain-containing protein [Desulfotomaculales bacterium]